MNTLRVLILIVGIICTIVCLFVQRTSKIDANGEVIETEITIGLPISPWFHRIEKKNNGFEFETNLLTFSTLFGIIGIASFQLCCRMEQRKSAAAVTNY